MEQWSGSRAANTDERHTFIVFKPNRYLFFLRSHFDVVFIS